MIAQNAGREGAVEVGCIRAEKNENIGFNAQTEEFEDLINAGVIDPDRVTRAALQNVASIADLLLTTEATISDFPGDGVATRRRLHGLLTASERKGMPMNIIERTVNDVTVLDLEGNLALNETGRFRKHVSGAIDGGVRKLIVNLAKVKYMDSSGLGELISCNTVLQRLNGHVKLLHLNNRLQYLLAITKLDSVFESFDSEPSAVSSFAPRAERIEDAFH